MLTYGKTKNLLLITTLSLSEVFFWTELIMNRKINSFAQKYRVEELSSVVSLVESSEWLEVEKDELVSLTEADQLIIDEDVLVDSILRYTDRLIDEHLYNRNLPSLPHKLTSSLTTSVRPVTLSKAASLCLSLPM